MRRKSIFLNLSLNPMSWYMERPPVRMRLSGLVLTRLSSCVTLFLKPEPCYVPEEFNDLKGMRRIFPMYFVDYNVSINGVCMVQLSSYSKSQKNSCLVHQDFSLLQKQGNNTTLNKNKKSILLLLQLQRSGKIEQQIVEKRR